CARISASSSTTKMRLAPIAAAASRTDASSTTSPRSSTFASRVGNLRPSCFFVLALALAACPAPPDPLSICASQCDGCCDADGNCQDGTTADQCGSAGSGCSQCNPGDACNAGACGPGSAGDPCMGVTAGGHCLNASTVQICSTPTGAGAPSLVNV